MLFASSSSSSAPAAARRLDLARRAGNQYGRSRGGPGGSVRWLVTESTDSFNLRVPTGPLASRGGGALGPTLALVDAEPTQPVDRLERALSQDIVGLGAGDDEQTASRGSGAGDEEFTDDPGTWPGSIGTGGTGGPVVSIPGRGGFPLKVTSLGRDQRGQFQFPRSGQRCRRRPIPIGRFLTPLNRPSRSMNCQSCPPWPIARCPRRWSVRTSLKRHAVWPLAWD